MARPTCRRLTMRGRPPLSLAARRRLRRIAMPKAKTYGQLIDELLPQNSDRRFRESWDLARRAIMQTHPVRFASGPAAVNIKAKSADATWALDGHRSTLQVDVNIAEFLLPHVEGS